MNSKDLLVATVDEIFDAFGGNHVWRNVVASYITTKCVGNEVKVGHCIDRIHELIHQYYDRQ